MHAQRAAEGGDAHQAVHGIGQLVAQRMEFVDHDHHAGRGIGQLPHVGGMPGGDQALAARDLMLQRVQRAPGVGQIEVADASDGVGQPFQLAECGASLEVEEHELEPVRRIGAGQRHAPGLQQHRLARARRAGHQGMRALLHQIQRERLRCGGADQCRRVRRLQPPAYDALPAAAVARGIDAAQRLPRRAGAIGEIPGRIVRPGGMPGGVGAVLASGG